MISSAQDIVRFGLFELDLKAGQLLRNGTRIRLPQQPVQLLAMLLERPGEIVTREELRQRLWTSDVFVDFDHGLNKSIQKIREVLGDSADSPRYIETIPRTGYRFIAPVYGGPKPAAYGLDLELQPMEVTQTAEETAAPRTSPMRAGSLRRRWYVLAASFAVLAAMLAAGVGWLIQRRSHVTEAIHSLAVLPLENLSGDPAQEYFADGMTDELITALAKNRSLRVVSRTSVMQYKGANKPLSEIARALGVDGILEGSVARSGDRVHVNLQLIYAPTDTHRWAESYDRDASAALSLPDELSQTIATQAGTAPSPVGPQRYVSPEAHDAYLQGRFYWFMGDNNRSKPYFEKAIQLQPDYAAAWCGLGDMYGVSAVEGTAPPAEAWAKAEPDIRKALALDDSLPEAHNSLGATYLFHYWDWRRAEEETRRAIELNPNYAEGHHIHSYTLWVQNRDTEALQEQKLATDIAPLDRPWALGFAYMYVRQFDAAINEFTALAQFRREFWTQFGLSEAYEFKGMDREAAEHMAQAFLAANDEKSAAAITLAFKNKGLRGVSEWLLNHQLAQVGKKYVSPWNLAWNYAHLQRKEETLAALEEAYTQRSPGLVFVQKEPVFDFLHSDERYRALIKRIGLPSAY